MKKLFCGGTIVTEEGSIQADLLVDEGKVLALGKDLPLEGAERINCQGKVILPGAIDVHTHFDLKVGTGRAVDDWYSGTVAAACGGTTTVVDHIAFAPQGSTPRQALEVYHNEEGTGLADGKAVIDYGLHGVLGPHDEEHFSTLGQLAQEGVTSFKIYLTYDDRLSDELAFKVLQVAKKDNLTVPVHCENHGTLTTLRQQFIAQGKNKPIDHAHSRPNDCEAEAVARYLKLAHIAGDANAYIVHLSTAEGLAEIDDAKAAGQKNILVETCPQYLLLDESLYQADDGIKYVMSPPLREKKDCEALWQGLADGRIDILATDHCPFLYSDKLSKGKDDFTRCPNGAPGVEERLLLAWSEGVAKGRISPERCVQVCCTNPAKAFGLWPQKGSLLPGSDADLVILDPQGQTRLTHEKAHTACDFISYEGFLCSGSIEQVYSRGELICDKGTFCGQKGAGRYLPRKTNSLAR